MTPNATAHPTPAAAPPPVPDGDEAVVGRLHLVFRLSGESFALPVDAVFEILDPLPVTTVPLASDHAPALVNVRGAIAPLVDIRRRLRLPLHPAPDTARLIVIEAPCDGEPLRLALLADTVEEVIEADPGARESLPELGARWPERFLSGVTRRDDALIIHLNPETLFQPDADRPALT